MPRNVLLQAVVRTEVPIPQLVAVLLRRVAENVPVVFPQRQVPRAAAAPIPTTAEVRTVVAYVATAAIIAAHAVALV